LPRLPVSVSAPPWTQTDGSNVLVLSAITLSVLL
jgi:hypothetical protein